MPIELLSPAKNLEYGCEAVNHGADALYIGAPAFGARAAATNTLADIETLVRYAHIYGVKVYATVNTLLFDSELEDAASMIHKLYEIGTDAIIIQDMGLLECDLPSIALHASTQCHNADVERIKFLEQVGFKRVVLARETSIQQMRQISNQCNVELEAFIHGALCVCYSGQCYMSQYLNRRSGNRGCCSQPCRSSYDLYTDSGRLIVNDRHLLSLKDFNASQHLSEMIAAGVCSFKIEGRLKDLSYVKNITAYYRQLIDAMIDGKAHTSSGHCTYFFTPDPERTYNRGYTDYFLTERKQMASISTQKSIGKYVGKVMKMSNNSLTIKSDESFAAGDGLCYFTADGKLNGFAVNHAQGNMIVPNIMPNINVGSSLWRNHDHRFEKTLHERSAERKIDVTIDFYSTPNGFGISIVDDDGTAVSTTINARHEESKNPQQMMQHTIRQLSKLGGTPFACTTVNDSTYGQYFLPLSTINQLRTCAVEELINRRVDSFKATCFQREDQLPPYPTEQIDYRANVINQKAELFYKRHGVRLIEHGLEQTEDYAGKVLMTTKYCLRYELNCCMKKDRGNSKELGIKATNELLLKNNEHWFRLEFDCQNCQMKILPLNHPHCNRNGYANKEQ